MITQSSIETLMDEFRLCLASKDHCPAKQLHAAKVALHSHPSYRSRQAVEARDALHRIFQYENVRLSDLNETNNQETVRNIINLMLLDFESVLGPGGLVGMMAIAQSSYDPELIDEAYRAYNFWNDEKLLKLEKAA